MNVRNLRMHPRSEQHPESSAPGSARVRDRSRQQPRPAPIHVGNRVRDAGRIGVLGLDHFRRLSVAASALVRVKRLGEVAAPHPSPSSHGGSPWA